MKELSAKAYKIGEHPSDGIGTYFFDPIDNRVWYMGSNSKYVNMGDIDRFSPEKLRIKLNASGLNLMSRKRNPKPKKGVMPAALKKYWASHRRGTKRKVKASRHHSSTPARSARSVNPRRGYKLVIQKGKTSLCDIGGKFATHGAPVIYPTSEAVLRAAKAYHSKYKMLRGYHFFASPC